jgi:hypothetical protein
VDWLQRPAFYGGGCSAAVFSKWRLNWKYHCNTILLRAPLVSQTLDALGFRSPFDTDHVVADLMRTWDERLKATPMFAAYNETKALFTNYNMLISVGRSRLIITLMILIQYDKVGVGPWALLVCASGIIFINTRTYVATHKWVRGSHLPSVAPSGEQDTGRQTAVS